MSIQQGAPHLRQLSPGGRIRLLLHLDVHDVGLPLRVWDEWVLTGVLAVVEEQRLPVERSPGLVSAVAPQDVEDTQGGREEGSTHPSNFCISISYASFFKLQENT